jgi:putative transposase
MPSYRQLLYHIVIRTKESHKTISQTQSDHLYAYIGGIIKNKNCHLYRINGMEDHIHILTDLHPSIALADFIRDIKISTSMWMKNCGLFPAFEGWSDKYGAFTCSYLDSGIIIDYIRRQREHHEKMSFEEEYRKLLVEAGIQIDEAYFP